MDINKEILSELIVHMKYAKYLPDKFRRETWQELIDRNKDMHLGRFSELKDDIEWAYSYVYNKKVLPSMRSLQFAGKAIDVSPSRMFNCSYLPVDSIDAFSETMFLLLNGTGVGYSVQKHHVERLPDIKKPSPKRLRRFLVSDNIQGWAEAIKVLLKSYTGRLNSTIVFDFSDIRPKGALLLTSGGKAPGPKPLREALVKITGVLDSKEDGDKLSPLEAHSVMCHIADAVLAGGIRRSALISLFNMDDEEMLSSKTGNWWELNPHFGRANNSAVILRHKISKDKFKTLIDKTKNSGAGEPGIFFTNDKEFGCNPCFSYDTPILTSEGYRLIGELEEEVTTFKNYKGEDVDGVVFCSGEKAIYRLELSNLKNIKTTINHVFMLVDGTSKEAQNLVHRDKLMPYYVINKEVNEYTKYGFIQGDGCTGRLASTTHKGIEVCIGEKDKDIAEIFNVVGVGDFYLSNYNDILKLLGFDASPLYDRILPSTLLTWEDKDIRMFLKGLWSANGSIIKNYRISFKSASKVLIEQLKHLLKENFNIDSYFTTNKAKEVTFSNGNYTCKESYDLNIVKYESILKFAELIGFVHEYKNKALEELILHRAPIIINKYVDDVEKVYDFSLDDDTHWGVINGVIAHNCGEISLRSHQFCNLVEINASDIETQEEFNSRAKAASIIATLQASYTDFYYLRDNWKKITEKESLIGVSLTGIASGNIFNLNPTEAAHTVVETNRIIAEKIGINPAARCTCVKPAGTTSLVLGTSSGIHAYHSKYYLRRVRIGKNESIYNYLKSNLSELIEDDYFRPHDTAIVTIPQKSPEGAALRIETSLELLERVNKVYNSWIKGGHIKGSNYNNVSVTVSVRDNEWDEVIEWMWNNKNNYTGISLLPFDGGSYKQAPFEECDENTYIKLSQYLHQIDLSQVIELDDSTDLQGELACSGGSCEIK